MNKKMNQLYALIMATMAATPVTSFAAPPAGTAYYSDTTNSYVQDQTSQIMGSLNSILCYMGAMGPSLMVNAGNYIALVDQNICDSKGSGGQSNNTGASYVTSVVNSSRASNADPMIVDAWLHPPEAPAGSDYVVYASASQAPSTTLPYGVFRMDFCGGPSCGMGKGLINASSSGNLSFYEYGTNGSDSEETKLALTPTSNTAGSGAASKTWTWGGGGSMNFTFQYNSNYFVRNDGSAAGDVCFDRNPTNAAESVWRYGLYDNTGAHVDRNSGFPVEYTTGGTTYSGYMGYYGLWLPVTPNNGDTVTKVTYSNNGATKSDYTLMKTGGKLYKFTTANKTLADLNKVTFWYYAQNNVGAAMTAGSQYELYWDDTTKQFYVNGKQNTSSGNMEPYATPVAVTNADMLAANSWGLFGWSQMMGGQFGISGSDFANLTGGSPSTIAVKTQTQDLVYPDQFASIGNLVCINDCPTAALIGTSNAGTGTAYSNQGWSPVASAAFVNYTLNGTTGNLIDPAPADVISTATTGTNAYGVRSGRLVTTADAATIQTRKNAACSNCDSFNQGDIDLLDIGSSYYVWETGGQPWNSLALLKDSGGNPVTFDAPLNVSFVVPSGAKYGNYQGATITLQYGGFGDLWGIPNTCVDLVTNSTCDFTQTQQYQQQNFRWTPNFSIPFDTTSGVVTANGGATTYYVKALDKEVRLAKVDCTTAGLSTSGLSTSGLPTSADFQDPTSKVGTKPTVTDAPRVIHGVKQY